MIVPSEQYTSDCGHTSVEQVSVDYSNLDGDCNSSDIQTLTLSTQDNGTARYITLKTDHYSVSDSKEILEIFKDFEQRASLLSIQHVKDISDYRVLLEKIRMQHTDGVSPYPIGFVLSTEQAMEELKNFGK
jgi:hypothetical protein